MTLSGYYTNFVEPCPAGYIQRNRQGLNGGMTFDIASALFPHKPTL
jgi:hypothetical protein